MTSRNSIFQYCKITLIKWRNSLKSNPFYEKVVGVCRRYHFLSEFSKIDKNSLRYDDIFSCLVSWSCCSVEIPLFSFMNKLQYIVTYFRATNQTDPIMTVISQNLQNRCYFVPGKWKIPFLGSTKLQYIVTYKSGVKRVKWRYLHLRDFSRESVNIVINEDKFCHF